jgi:hypothetical protein
LITIKITSIVIEGDWIVPAYSLNDHDGLLDLGRASGAISGGYSIQTPCKIILKLSSSCTDGEVFSYPLGIEEDPLIGDLDPILEVINDPGVLTPGWEASASLSAEHVLHIDERSLILEPVDSCTYSGTCPILIAMDGAPVIEKGKNGSEGIYSSIRFLKEAVIGEDGIIQLSFIISLENISDTSL